jgi:protein ImuB
VDRLACVNIDEFPLQLLLGRRPSWRSLPAAVVDRENAQGVVLWANGHARERRILPGMRYAAALSLSRQLRAGAVNDAEVAAAVDRLAEKLRTFTADVEPSQHEPGVFWVGASGLSLLYPSLDEWAGLVRAALAGEGYHASVAVGFSRFGAYAVARTIEDTVVFDDPAGEQARAAEVPIERLGFEPRLRDALAKLGITTLGGFLDLPAPGVRKRFGSDVHRLHQLAKGELFSPLQPQYPLEPASGVAIFDHPECNLDRLMAVIEQLLSQILAELSKRDELAAAVGVRFLFDDGARAAERVEPASATLEAEQILDLVRLRLEGLKLTAGVAEVELAAESHTAARRQRDLFEQQSPRDLEAANRALARVRAELGDGAVVRATLRDGHLPEASFEWEPVKQLEGPAPRNVAQALRPLVRRIYSRPVALSKRRQNEPRAALITLYEDRRVEERVGPYIVTGGWWVREVGREYYYVRTETGRCLWLYYDRRRQCWFLHGEVE